MVLLAIYQMLNINDYSFTATGTSTMVNYSEIPLDLQLKEAHHQIAGYKVKGQCPAQFLSPIFLQQFPAIMDNQILVEWDGITGLFERLGTIPITLIDSDILNEWRANLSMWEVDRSLQHSWCTLAMVCHTLVVSHKGKPVVVYGASFVYIPAHQARTGLLDALNYLAASTEDCIVLVLMPAHAIYSPQLQQGKYYTLLPINNDPTVDQGLVCIFTDATLLKAS